ncbi:hypothetical protein METHP14_350010 [Pseudomonas sp. P14-2025]
MFHRRRFLVGGLRRREAAALARGDTLIYPGGPPPMAAGKFIVADGPAGKEMSHAWLAFA